MLNAQEVCERAYRSVGKGCVYRLGKGGMHPEAEHPWVVDAGEFLCDCSGFAMWCLGLSRFQAPVWLDTTKIASDAAGPHTFFVTVPMEQARPSDLIVYGDHDGHQGHVGVIVQRGDTLPTIVIHCSSGNQKHGDAIGASDPTLWLKRNGIVARCLKVAA